MANQDQSQPKVVAPSQVANEAKQTVDATNKDVDKAGQEAANRLKGQSKERFNVTDAVLGSDDQHSVNVKKAQAQSFGEDYDPKTDPEVTPTELSPAPSQNQNNLKHPAGEEWVDPHASKNYLGQPL